jgi:hypothetical protein
MGGTVSPDGAKECRAQIQVSQKELVDGIVILLTIEAAFASAEGFPQLTHTLFQTVQFGDGYGRAAAVGCKPGIDQDRILFAHFVPERGSLGKILHPAIAQLDHKKNDKNQEHSQQRSEGHGQPQRATRRKGRPSQYFHTVSIAHLVHELEKVILGLSDPGEGTELHPGTHTSSQMREQCPDTAAIEAGKESGGDQ